MNSKDKAKRAAGVRGKTILVVDDDTAVREMIGRVLAAEDYEVLTAANGTEALGVAASHRLDLVILDLNMPVKGGWDTFAELTTKDPLLAVIIITAKPNQFFTSLGAGVGALLEKPLDFPTLLKTVTALLKESDDLRLARITGHHLGLRYRPAARNEARK